MTKRRAPPAPGHRRERHAGTTRSGGLRAERRRRRLGRAPADAAPGGVYDTPLEFDAERIGALPRTFISCTSPALPTIDASRARVRRDAGWTFLEMATGHDPMISAPDALVRQLVALA
jgi:hypothetical protein